MTKIVASALFVMMIFTCGWSPALGQTVSIIIVRHPETVPEGPSMRPLTAVGQQRADLLIHTLRGIQASLTDHWRFATTRAR